VLHPWSVVWTHHLGFSKKDRQLGGQKIKADHQRAKRGSGLSRLYSTHSRRIKPAIQRLGSNFTGVSAHSQHRILIARASHARVKHAYQAGEKMSCKLCCNGYDKSNANVPKPFGDISTEGPDVCPDLT